MLSQILTHRDLHGHLERRALGCKAGRPRRTGKQHDQRSHKDHCESVVTKGALHHAACLTWHGVLQDVLLSDVFRRKSLQHVQCRRLL